MLHGIWSSFPCICGDVMYARLGLSVLLFTSIFCAHVFFYFYFFNWHNLVGVIDNLRSCFVRDFFFRFCFCFVLESVVK